MVAKDKGLYTTAETAAICGVTPPTVRRWIRENRLHAVKTATKRLMIPTVEISRILGGCEQQDPGARTPSPKNITTSLE